MTTDRILLSSLDSAATRRWSVRVGPFAIGWNKLDLDANIVMLDTIAGSLIAGTQSESHQSLWHVHGRKGWHLLYANRIDRRASR